MTTSSVTSIRKGGSWLLDDTASADVFTPEQMTEEHRLMAKTTSDFVGRTTVQPIAKAYGTVAGVRKGLGVLTNLKGRRRA